MEEEFDNKLKVNAEDGSEVTINVLDIIESETYSKSFIIYTIDGQEETAFASILNEGETTFSLDTINSKEELDFVHSEIEKIINESEEEE